jgi:hypothetical protein
MPLVDKPALMIGTMKIGFVAMLKGKIVPRACGRNDRCGPHPKRFVELQRIPGQFEGSRNLVALGEVATF